MIQFDQHLDFEPKVLGQALSFKDEVQLNRQAVSDYKVKVGCMRCRYNDDPIALDLHHRPGTTKLFAISRALSNGDGRVWEEILKCDVICANCHRIIHKKGTKEEVG